MDILEIKRKDNIKTIKQNLIWLIKTFKWEIKIPHTQINGWIGELVTWLADK